MLDEPEQLQLALYADADFAAESDAKSTSGGFLVLQGPRTHFPLAWLSKKQTSVSRSTTKAEVISLAHFLYQEGLPVGLCAKLLGRKMSLALYEDNQATILVARKGCQN